MDVIVHGADSETLHGKPMTLQFFSDDMEYETCIWVNEKNATDAFLDWADSLPNQCLHVVYCHNLDFDLPEFLWRVKHDLVTTGGDFKIEMGGWLITGVYGAPTFCRMTHRKSNRSILIVDSFLWFQGTLAKAAELFCPDLPKLKMPEGLGEKQFKMTDQKFYDYAMRDAEVAYNIGVNIQKLVRQFDIRQPVSLADMAAKIFRHHFLKHTIPQPNRAVIIGALKSYHGGKNNVVAGAAPGWHMGITAMDISSAYPYAMAQLPSMSYKELYKRYQKMPAELCEHIESVPPLGVYCVSGIAKECNWPVIFTHGFKPISGKFMRVWIQGIELNEALRSGEITITNIRGHYYDAEKDDRASPFKAYCDYFYDKKQSEPNKIQREMFKRLLNACYGKFIQTRKNSRIIYTDVDSGETEETHDLIAGGMFHPFIASAITAHCRAYMHQLEHAHKAFHTATDGNFSYTKTPRRVPMSPRKGLGVYEIEARGDLVLFRNKCYILYGKKTDKSIQSQYFKGKHIIKYAKHGFQGTVYDLERMVAHNRRKYEINKPNRLKESLKRGLNVNEFVRQKRTLKVGPIGVKNKACL